MSSHHSALAKQARRPGKLRSRRAGQRHQINQTIRRCLSKHPRHRAEFLNFLAIVQSRSNILELSSVRALPFCGDLEGLVLHLRDVFGFLGLAVRPLYQWHPSGCDGHENRTSVALQYRSLVLHLFAKYDVPEYLTMSWHKFDLRALIRIGRGKSVRSAYPTLTLSKSEARAIWRVPHDVQCTEAIQWAATVALGGSEKLANIVCRALWIWIRESNPFSVSVVKFLIRAEKNAAKNPDEHPSFACGEVEQIMTFARKMKFDPPHAIVGYQANTDDPLMPHLDLDGKGLRWIRRLMANWRHEVELPASKFKNKNYIYWNRSAIAEFKWHDGNHEWTINELCNSRALIWEGLIMHHCVATYDKDCFKNWSTIWSVRRHHFAGENKITKRMATIEVDARSRSIAQVSGKHNQYPSKRVITCMKAWAEDQKLALHERWLA